MPDLDLQIKMPSSEMMSEGLLRELTRASLTVTPMRPRINASSYDIALDYAVAGNDADVVMRTLGDSSRAELNDLFGDRPDIFSEERGPDKLCFRASDPYFSGTFPPHIDNGSVPRKLGTASGVALAVGALGIQADSEAPIVRGAVLGWLRHLPIATTRRLEERWRPPMTGNIVDRILVEMFRENGHSWLRDASASDQGFEDLWTPDGVVLYDPQWRLVGAGEVVLDDTGVMVHQSTQYDSANNDHENKRRLFLRSDLQGIGMRQCIFE